MKKIGLFFQLWGYMDFFLFIWFHAILVHHSKMSPVFVFRTRPEKENTISDKCINNGKSPWNCPNQTAERGFDLAYFYWTLIMPLRLILC